MLTRPTVNNAANLSMFMVNVSAKLLEPARVELPEASVLDLKAHYRGLKYVRETLNTTLLMILLIASPEGDLGIFQIKFKHRN